MTRHCSLKNLNTFAVDASANYFCSFTSLDELLVSLKQLPDAVDLLLLGGGSNILFVGDYPGAILHNRMQGSHVIKEDDDNVWIQVAGGVNWHDFVIHSIQQGFSGLENLSLIPGTVGAAPIQNIGAYGVELSDCFDSLEALELRSGQVQNLSKAECHFGYRQSLFKQPAHRNRWVVLSVVFKLFKKPRFLTQYGEIERELKQRQVTQLTPQLMSDVICSIRKRKLPDPAILPNAGSFFKNPVVSKSQYERLILLFPEMISYPLDDGSFKLAAGWLIDQLGWKGREVDGAKVHDNQALVIVNLGGGGEAILSLAERIQCNVKSVYGVKLEIEPLVVRSV